MRPSTEGCTEWSCVYHGEENREKAGHAEDCPVRAADGWLEWSPGDERPAGCVCEGVTKA